MSLNKSDFEGWTSKIDFRSFRHENCSFYHSIDDILSISVIMTSSFASVISLQQTNNTRQLRGCLLVFIIRGFFFTHLTFLFLGCARRDLGVVGSLLVFEFLRGCSRHGRLSRLKIVDLRLCDRRDWVGINSRRLIIGLYIELLWNWVIFDYTRNWVEEPFSLFLTFDNVGLSCTLICWTKVHKRQLWNFLYRDFMHPCSLYQVIRSFQTLTFAGDGAGATTGGVSLGFVALA